MTYLNVSGCFCCPNGLVFKTMTDKESQIERNEIGACHVTVRK